jgi:glucose-6-phosphate 1-dehydrogenase
VIRRLVVFGGTGDLMGRYLLPGLAALQARGHLPERFELVGAARDDWDDEHFRDWATGWLKRRTTGVDAAAAAALVSASRYHRLDLDDPANVTACLAGEGPAAVYLALPPAVFPGRGYGAPPSGASCRERGGSRETIRGGPRQRKSAQSPSRRTVG